MFEQEIEMEKKEGSSLGPIVVVLLLVGLFVGGLGVVIYQGNIAISPDQAATVLQNRLKTGMPVTVTFHTGKVSYKAADAPSDAQYKLLEKAGYIKMKGTEDFSAMVELTPAGKAWLDSVGVTGVPDGNTVGYKLPLATRKLVSVDKITKLATRKFQLDFTWKWEPTKAGELFDIAGSVAQSLPLYERGSLIDQHGGNYYHAAPKAETLVVAKLDGGWEPIR